jgi:hypothetical protein
MRRFDHWSPSRSARSGRSARTRRADPPSLLWIQKRIAQSPEAIEQDVRAAGVASR